MEESGVEGNWYDSIVSLGSRLADSQSIAHSINYVSQIFVF